MSDVHEFVVAGAERLDKSIFEYLSALGDLPLSRSQIKKLIEEGEVTVAGQIITKAGWPLTPGETVVVRLSPPKGGVLEPWATKLDIHYEDEWLLVVNKPAGMSVHPGAGEQSQTLANALVHHIGSGLLEVGSADRPGIVHRLDKDTTGLLVVAKDIRAHAHLAQQFSERTTERIYSALALVMPRSARPLRTSDHGEIALNIDRDQKNRERMAVVMEGGREAVTEWIVVDRMRYAALLDVKLRTGRTHQIRVHLDAIGSPVIGDTVYGDFSSLPRELQQAGETLGRQALHARVLGFTHPRSSDRLRFEVAPPQDFLSCLERFRGN